MLKQRIITAVLLLVFFSAVVASKSVSLFSAVMGVVIIVAAWEWGRLLGSSKTAIVALWLSLALFFVHYSYNAFSNVARGGDQVNFLSRDLALIYCGIAAALWCSYALAFLYYKFDLNKFPALNGIVAATLLFGAWLGAITLFQRNLVMLLSVIAVPIVADTAAYFVGRRFGKRKLAPQVSPGKTIEGACGGLLAVALIHGAFVITQKMPYAWIIVYLVLAVFSIIGDLFESLLKRKAGVKDSSQLLPGHGGILDRIDAQLPVLPMATVAMLASIAQSAQ